MANTKFGLSALDSRCERVLSAPTPKRPSYTFRGCDDHIPSVVTSDPFVATTTKNVYTGNNMVGVSTMHKSNSVPVFSQESAIDIAHMRR